MKLYNRSLIPDDVLYPVLVKAGRLAGARTEGVVMRVNGNWRNWVTHGEVYRGYSVNKNWLHGKGASRNKVWIKTDGGRVELWLGLRQGLSDLHNNPTTYNPLDGAARRLANRFFSSAIHEWKHIADFQDRFAKFSQRKIGGRRPNWEDRPEEIRACATVYQVLSNSSGLKLFPEALRPLFESIERTLFWKHLE